MVPLLVILTILGFWGVDLLVQHFQKKPVTVKAKFNPATDPIVYNGGLSWADGGEPIEGAENSDEGNK